MFKVIIREEGQERELEGEFDTKIEAETYAECVGFEEFKVIPVNE